MRIFQTLTIFLYDLLFDIAAIVDAKFILFKLLLSRLHHYVKDFLYFIWWKTSTNEIYYRKIYLKFRIRDEGSSKERAKALRKLFIKKTTEKRHAIYGFEQITNTGNSTLAIFANTIWGRKKREMKLKLC